MLGDDARAGYVDHADLVGLFFQQVFRYGCLRNRIDRRVFLERHGGADRDVLSDSAGVVDAAAEDADVACERSEVDRVSRANRRRVAG